MRGRREPEESLIPVGFLAKFFDDNPDLPPAAAILGLTEEEAAEELRWATPSELEAERAQFEMPSLEELLKNPDVAAVVEASALMKPISE